MVSPLMDDPHMDTPECGHPVCAWCGECHHAMCEHANLALCFPAMREQMFLNTLTLHHMPRDPLFYSLLDVSGYQCTPSEGKWTIHIPPTMSVQPLETQVREEKAFKEQQDAFPLVTTYVFRRILLAPNGLMCLHIRVEDWQEDVVLAEDGSGTKKLDERGNPLIQTVLLTKDDELTLLPSQHHPNTFTVSMDNLLEAVTLAQQFMLDKAKQAMPQQTEKSEYRGERRQR